MDNDMKRAVMWIMAAIGPVDAQVIQDAINQARRDALEEAARICEERVERMVECRDLASEIRLLAAMEKEKDA